MNEAADVTLAHDDAIRQVLEKYLSWMSPSLALAAAAALVAALVYAVVAARPLKYVPCYWVLALAGLATGQIVAQDRLRWLPVGTLALGTGLVVCAVLFLALHLLTLWYTEAHRTRAP
jgi:FtsH-binding integral membrane protein